MLYTLKLHSYISNIFNKKYNFKKIKVLENIKKCLHVIRWKFDHNKIDSLKKKSVSLAF